MFTFQARLDDHHIGMINVTEQNGLEEVSNRLISQKNTCVRSDILMNPRVN